MGEITNTRLLAVEGDDEEKFFQSFVKHLRIRNVDIRSVGGVSNFRKNLPGIVKSSGFIQNVNSLGIVRDADNDPYSAFMSIQSVLRNLRLPVPVAPMVPITQFYNPINRDLRVTICILPNEGSCGMLEDLCLSSVSGDIAIKCVNLYFACLRLMFRKMPKNLSKARVRVYLASRKFLETKYFNSIQKCIEETYESRASEIGSTSVARIDAFLASKYKPTLRLGEAAEAHYWDFHNKVFERLNSFIKEF